ncbi:MAG: hypothetical protein ACNA78_01320 [Balneolaceae bacterium]
MKPTEQHIFCYPPNLQELDLATMVTMYRERGEIRRSKPGTYFACALTRRLIREAKWWFGLYYSQKAWDSLLTKSSEGYPLTEAELNALGLVVAGGESPPRREKVEANLGVLPKLGYLIVNDLKQFGFLHEDGQGVLLITPRGESALQGIARRIYQKRFVPEMLHSRRSDAHTGGHRIPSPDQTSLF